MPQAELSFTASSTLLHLRPWNKRKRHFISIIAKSHGIISNRFPAWRGNSYNFQPWPCVSGYCGIDLYFPNMLEWVQEFASSASCDAAAASGAFLMLRLGLKVFSCFSEALQINTWTLWSEMIWADGQLWLLDGSRSSCWAEVPYLTLNKPFYVNGL